MTTLKDIADLVGVSRATVSYVLNGRADEFKISPMCSEKVLQAAKKLQYQKNYLARALSTGKSMTVGLVMTQSLDNRMWGAIAQGVEEGVVKCKKDLLIISAERDGEPLFSRGLKYLQNKRIDALIITSWLPAELVPEDLSKAGLPIVFIARPEVEHFPVVNLDFASGIRDSLVHLHDLGHKDVLYINKGDENQKLAKVKIEAFRRCAHEMGIAATVSSIDQESEYFSDLSHHIRHNLKELRRKFNLGKSTAVICHNDTVGLALYKVLAERELRIPEDISVIGFDDLHASHAIPAMTTVSHMFRQMGMKAVEVAEELAMNGKELIGRQIMVPSELVVRESTGPALNSR